MTVFGRFLGVDAADYFGIFDGHGGDATAHYVGEQLHHVLYAHIKKLVNVTNDDATLVLYVVVMCVAKIRILEPRVGAR